MTADLNSFLDRARTALLAELSDEGHWTGELSSSALATATALIALKTSRPSEYKTILDKGVRWLVTNQNPDGGWGDTVISFSNISTTLLCRAALELAGAEGESTRRADDWIARYCGGFSPESIASAVVARYGSDRTFSVPILMACALAGILGRTPGEGWRFVLPLPFELAVFPRSWFGALRLPVVSYALPALIAIGYARYHHAPPFFPLQQVRRAVWPRVSKMLTRIQPPNGGFLEAIPLTSFVAMALSSASQAGHPVVRRCLEFILHSVRADGSWPIDTNLATWVTTLSVEALGQGDLIPPHERQRMLRWLLDQQYRERHAYTDSPPGGWAWTNLPGGVPDADDTPGALLALRMLQDDDSRHACLAAAGAGARWLLSLQNRDGGIPTFCRGWGKLPFDRSSPDLTAHAIRAWHAWLPDLPSPSRGPVRRGLSRGLAYLTRAQRSDGSWIPLWFGNQHHPGESNPVYGTARVLTALCEFPELARLQLENGVLWLLRNQNEDGGWGGGKGTPSSVEETALALDALASTPESADTDRALQTGLAWLMRATEGGTSFSPSPIGFYFAKLWYYEKLYPVIWTASALRKIKARWNRPGSAAGSLLSSSTPVPQ